jgi:hypothetical protein
MTGDWLSNHSTLIVGVVGIVVSGILGPAASVWLSRKSARQQFKRDLIVARRDDLRQLVDEAALLLIWTAVCQVASTGCPRLGRASVSVKGAAGLAGARRAVRLIYAGWLPQDRVSS